jgi:hypothetical protein
MLINLLAYYSVMLRVLHIISEKRLCFFPSLLSFTLLSGLLISFGQVAAQSSFVEYRDYHNSIYDVSLQYPADYEEGESGAAWFVTFIPTEFSRTSFSIFLDSVPNNNRYLTIDDYIETYRTQLEESSLRDFRLISFTPAVLGNQDAYTFLYQYTNPVTGGKNGGLDVLTIRDNDIFTLTFLGPSEELASNGDIIGTIIDSVRFGFESPGPEPESPGLGPANPL